MNRGKKKFNHLYFIAENIIYINFINWLILHFKFLFKVCIL